MADLFGIRHAFREASENILVAATHEGVNRKWRLAQARDDIARGFCPEAPFGKGEVWLVERIATTISDGDGYSLLDEHQARKIVNELFKHLKPEDV